MKRADFICTIGYQDEVAIVDATARKRYGTMTAAQLLEQGLLRQAFCAALYDGQLERFLPEFASRTGMEVRSSEALQRMFGVFEVPEEVTKVSAIS